MLNIAVIGAGQLGSRHLQALAGLKKEAAIYVVDSSPESLKIAEERFNQVSAGFNGKINFYSNISELPKEVDLAIIATNSIVRRIVIEQLTNHTDVKYLILEKFLFTKPEDYGIIENLLADKNIKTWVNCPNRIFDFYKQLKNEIKGPIHFSVVGNQWGLGCNGIHYTDLFSFFSNQTDIKFTNTLLDKNIIESKRKGYVEFTGTITGVAGENTLQLTAFPNSDLPLIITINTPFGRYIIEETEKLKVRYSLKDNNWTWQESIFNIPFQSQLTNIVIDEILATDNCELTSYQSSSKLHVAYLNNLLDFLQKTKQDPAINECLIT